jgi:hypothetical protein
MRGEPKQLKEMVELAISKSRRLKEGMLRSKWKEIAGELSKKSEVLYIKNGVLYVSAENSLWIQHLNFKKMELLERCNEVLGGKYLVDLFFRAGKVNLEKHFLSEESFMEDYDPEKIQLTPEEIHSIRKSLDGVEDEVIREKLFSLNVGSKKKEKFLLGHGYKVCTNCHVLHNTEGELCTVCDNKIRLGVQEKLFALFKERLEEKRPLSYLDAKGEMCDLSLEEFDQAKRKKLDKIYKEIWIYYRGRDMDELFDSCRKYFILELGIEDLDEVDTKVREYIGRLNRGEIIEG